MRVELQIRELQREYGKAGLKRRRGELELDEENFAIIDPVRQVIGRSIDLNAWKNDPSGEIAKIDAALATIEQADAGDKPLKAQYIAADTRYWQERLQEIFRTENPKNPLRFLAWLFSQKGYRRTQAWKSLLQGVAQMCKSQKRLDESEKQRQEITGENDEYRTDLRELSLVWEMLRKLYGDTKTYEDHLRRTPQGFFGMRVAGGAALHSPKIHLQTSHSGEEMANHLNDLVAPGTLTMGAGMIHAPAIQLQFAEGQLVHQKEEPYLSESQRKILLELVMAEEKSWEEKKRDVVVQNIHGDRILASWRLMRQYVEFLIQRIEAREKINPKVFHRGTLFERVVLRVFAELARSDPPSFSCAMLWGTEEQGNLLYQSFASALARKMWEMEKKWGSMSDQTRRQWLGSHGDIEHLAPSGIVNVIRLAAFDYWSS